MDTAANPVSMCIVHACTARACMRRRCSAGTGSLVQPDRAVTHSAGTRPRLRHCLSACIPESVGADVHLVGDAAGTCRLLCWVPFEACECYIL